MFFSVFLLVHLTNFLVWQSKELYFFIALP